MKLLFFSREAICATAQPRTQVSTVTKRAMSSASSRSKSTTAVPAQPWSQAQSTAGSHTRALYCRLIP